MVMAFLRDNLQTVLSAAGAALGLLAAAVTFLVKFVKNARGKKLAEQLIAVANAVIPFIGQAEKFAGYSGQEKREFVLTKANQFAIGHGIVFDAAAVGKMIEELIALTKDVNGREKDKGPKAEA